LPKVFGGFEQLSSTNAWQVMHLVKQSKTAWFSRNHTKGNNV